MVSGFDSYVYKDELLAILREVPGLQGDIHSMTLMALRYMIYDVLEISNPLGYTDEEDTLLQETHFKYIKSL